MTDITQLTDEQLIHELTRAWKDAPIGVTWPTVARYVRSLIPPAAQPVTRVPVAMTEGSDILTVACNDGTVWLLMEQGTKWIPVAPIPQPGATPAKFALPPASVCLTPAKEAAQDKDRQDAEETMHDAQMAAERELHDLDPVREAAHELLAALKASLEVMDRYNGHHEVKNRAADVIAMAEQRS